MADAKCNRLQELVARAILTGDHPSYEANFVWVIRLASGPENVVEPNRWLMVNIRMLPGIPRKVRLRLPCHKAPIDRRDAVLSGNGQGALKRAAIAPRHIFRAQNRPVKLLEPEHASLKFFGLVVVVERNHVRQRELDFFRRTEFFR